MEGAGCGGVRMWAAGARAPPRGYLQPQCALAATCTIIRVGILRYVRVYMASGYIVLAYVSGSSSGRGSDRRERVSAELREVFIIKVLRLTSDISTNSIHNT